MVYGKTLYLSIYILTTEGTSVVKLAPKIRGVNWDVLAPHEGWDGRTILTKVKA